MNQRTGAAGGELFLTEGEADAVVRILDSVLRRRETELDRSGTASALSNPHSIAGRIIAARRQRARFLPASLIGEPAWDLLLVLFVEPRGLPVTEAVERSGVATTTALRWIEILKDHQLVNKVQCEVDRRIWVVSISSEGRNLLTHYFSSISPDFFCEGVERTSDPLETSRS